MKLNLRKIIIGTGSLGLILAPFIILSVGRKAESNAAINGVGSNSVSPFILGYAQDIYKYQYANTGSGDGYKSQLSESVIADFGMTSSLKTPSNQNASIKDRKTWIDNKITTVTWAIDAIGIGIHIPSSMNIKNGEVPKINAEKLAEVYKGNLINWADLITNKEPGYAGNDIVKPIYINNGKETSGKSEAFVKGLIKNQFTGMSSMTKEEIDKFEHHKTLPGSLVGNSYSYNDDFTKYMQWMREKRGL